MIETRTEALSIESSFLFFNQKAKLLTGNIHHFSFGVYFSSSFGTFSLSRPGSVYLSFCLYSADTSQLSCAHFFSSGLCMSRFELYLIRHRLYAPLISISTAAAASTKFSFLVFSFSAFFLSPFFWPTSIRLCETLDSTSHPL